MKRQLIKSICGIVLFIVLFALPFFPSVKNYLTIPTEVNLYTNSTETFQLTDSAHSFNLIDQSDQDIVKLNNSHVKPLNVGNTNLKYQYKDFPLKKINVNVKQQYQVIPGGQSIGVNLETLGVLVVGYHYLGEGEDSQSPGRDLGIKIGDNILEMNQQAIQSIADIGSIVTESGANNQPIQVKYQRDNQIFEEELMPSYDEKTDSYKIGLYIRDSAAGIGTLTFLDPKTNMYGALGHVIADVDTKEPIEIKSGTIVKSRITSIQKGDSGIPGEKRASFNKNENLLGNITKNSSFGVFGQLNIDLKEENVIEPLPIAYSDEVKEGPAQILTVINEEEVETFDIEIISAVEQTNPATKGMVIKVTDERLLEKTGGIVQGMSGSPIIQDNKIVGAVTHVFVNDPTSGYGIHIEWMLEEAEINYKETFAKAS